MTAAERKRAAEREREAIIASPSDPRTEYVPARLAAAVVCRCPRTVLDDGPRSWQLKLWHSDGCARPRRPVARVVGGPVRVEAADDWMGLGAHLARLPAPKPCPRCGNVAFSALAGGGRRCTGPDGCGHEWVPGRRSATVAA